MAVEYATEDQGSSDLLAQTYFSTSNAQDEETEKTTYTIDGENLKQLIVSQDLKTEMSFLLFILAGLKESGKNDVLKKVFDALVDKKGKEKNLSTVGEHNQEGLSWYELSLAGDSSIGFDWSFFTRSSGYLRCFLSALAQYAHKENLSFSATDQKANDKFFKDSTLNRHFCSIFESLNWQFLPKAHERCPPKLLAGLSLVNIWDLEGMDEALMLVLSLLVGQLKQSFAILGLNSQKHVKMLASPESSDATLSEEYSKILRIVNLTRSHSSHREGTCIVAGLVTPDEELSEDTPSDLQLLMQKTVGSEDENLDLGKSLGDPCILNANKPDEMRDILEGLILKHKKDCSKTVPLSWVLLRSAFFKSGELYVEKEKLRNVASELGIDDEFDCFLADFTGMGSIIHNPRIPALDQYVILNPVDFCYHLNCLFKTRFDGDLERGIVPESYMKRIFGSDAEFFQYILTSSKHAIKLEASKVKPFANADSEPTLTEHTTYFIPAIRKAKPDTKKNARSLFLRVKPTFLPNNVGQLLVEQLLYCSATRLVQTECSNVTILEFNRSLQFKVVFHSNACEIRLDSANCSSLELIEALKALVIKACIFVVRCADRECVPLSTEIRDIGLMCTRSEEFHPFRSDVTCHECKERFQTWYHIYKMMLKEANENAEIFKYYPIVSPQTLTTFGENLSRQCHQDTEEEQKKLMETFGLQLQNCSSPNFRFSIISALHAHAAKNEGSTFAFYHKLEDLKPVYKKIFCQSFI